MLGVADQVEAKVVVPLQIERILEDFTYFLREPHLRHDRIDECSDILDRRRWVANAADAYRRDLHYYVPGDLSPQGQGENAIRVTSEGIISAERQ